LRIRPNRTLDTYFPCSFIHHNSNICHMPIDPVSESAQQSNQLKELPYNQKVFQAAGHTYYVEDKLSIHRYRLFQRMEIELGFGMKFSELANKIQKAYDLANQSKLGDVAVLLHSVIEGSVFIAEKEITALYVATLFINRADEDRKGWTPTLAKEKLKDWEDEGIEVNFFLVTALSKVGNFAETLKEISQMIERVGQIKQTEPTLDLSDLPQE